jgi:AraC-like DNA-binding protein
LRVPLALADGAASGQPAVMISVLLYGVAVGGFLATAAGMLRQRPIGPVRWVGAVFLVTAAGHAIDNLPAPGGINHPNVIAWVLSISAVGLFWAFVQASFTDQPRWRWVWLAPTAAVLACALLGATLPRPAASIAWFAYNAAVMALMAHAFWIIVSSWRGDLVDPRRHIRAPILAAAVIYILAIQAVDVSGLLGERLIIPEWVQAAALAGLAIVGAGLFLVVQPNLIDPRGPPAVAAPTIDPADRALAAKLDQAMGAGAIWKREALTIANLADHLGCPEHRLRALINAQLGHRNFAAFINARRIEAAQAAMLAEPRKAVSAIAFEHGFASLGPFNRAFKDLTGATPTEWRRQKLAEPENPSPISEKSA